MNSRHLPSSASTQCGRSTVNVTITITICWPSHLPSNRRRVYKRLPGSLAIPFSTAVSCLDDLTKSPPRRDHEFAPAWLSKIREEKFHGRACLLCSKRLDVSAHGELVVPGSKTSSTRSNGEVVVLVSKKAKGRERCPDLVLLVKNQQTAKPWCVWGAEKQEGGMYAVSPALSRKITVTEL